MAKKSIDGKSFTFEAEAHYVKERDEVGVWTDGIGAFYDKTWHGTGNLVAGKRYRVTIEEIA